MLQLYIMVKASDVPHGCDNSFGGVAPNDEIKYRRKGGAAPIIGLAATLQAVKDRVNAGLEVKDKR
jgi:hypothetical protein